MPEVCGMHPHRTNLPLEAVQHQLRSASVRVLSKLLPEKLGNYNTCLQVNARKQQTDTIALVECCCAIGGGLAGGGN